MGVLSKATSFLRTSHDSLLALREQTRDLVAFLQDNYYRESLRRPPYDDPRHLAPYGYKIFSESDEDGIINEIFRRIGVEDRTFFEFGVGNGGQNNTVNLLVQGWRGFWIEGSPDNMRVISTRLAAYIRAGELKALQAFITRDDINQLISRLGVPESLDLLSIDIDGNDYWVWEAMERISPRVVVIEYNATLRPPHSVVMEYKDDYVWDGTSYFGASLVALEKLGRAKGYSLVGCNFTGVNAFFVRNDLLGDFFLTPLTAEKHYEPAKYFRLRAGHRSGIGPYVRI